MAKQLDITNAALAELMADRLNARALLQLSRCKVIIDAFKKV